MRDDTELVGQLMEKYFLYPFPVFCSQIFKNDNECIWNDRGGIIIEKLNIFFRVATVTNVLERLMY